jgi:hypothetical protein
MLLYLGILAEQDIPRTNPGWCSELQHAPNADQVLETGATSRSLWSHLDLNVVKLDFKD